MDVYSPREDSELLCSLLAQYAKDKDVLDMGTGSGILTLSAALYAKRVAGVDINPQAIVDASDGAPNNVTFIESDMFTKITGDFDLIITNPPYLPSEGEFDVALDGGKHGYEWIWRFLDSVGEFLRPQGKVLLLFSSVSKKGKIEERIERNGFCWKNVLEKHQFFETLYVYELKRTPVVLEMVLSGISDIVLFARGKRGLIYTGIYKNKKVAVKVKHPNSFAVDTISHEASVLKEINKHGIGPNLIFSTSTMLVYDFVEGSFIEEYSKKRGKEEIKEVLLDVLEQMKTLDTLLITKFEMHRPYKHILIGDSVVLLDFERCKKDIHPKNVTQFMQFLTSGGFSEVLKTKGIMIDKEKVLTLCKEYKKTYADNIYADLKNAVSHK